MVQVAHAGQPQWSPPPVRWPCLYVDGTPCYVLFLRRGDLATSDVDVTGVVRLPLLAMPPATPKSRVIWKKKEEEDECD